jgi:hypothetical protein
LPPSWRRVARLVPDGSADDSWGTLDDAFYEILPFGIVA